MTYQDGMKIAIDDMYADLFKYAEKLGNKLNFVPDLPGAKNRSPLDMLRECVSIPDMFIPMLQTQVLPTDFEEKYPEGLNSLDDCKRYFEERKHTLYDAVTNFPSEKLSESIETPWGTYTWAQMIAYLHWNPAWHAGQLAYIGLMHGDQSM